MKKNNREQYLKAWLTYLKGKNQLDPKTLADSLDKTLKGALAPITMKRYTATVMTNLYENGFLAGKDGKRFSGKPLEIVQEITLPVLDKSLTQDYKKIKFTEADQPVEPLAEALAVIKPRKAARQKRAEVVTAKKAPGRKPGRKPGKKAAAKVPIVKGKKPGAKGTGLVGRKADFFKRGEEVFFYAMELTQRVEDLEREIANYERVFEAVKQLFSREMEEIEEWLAGVLK